MRNNINPARKITIVMVGLAFLLAWLTYRFIERPIAAASLGRYAPDRSPHR
jgi:peptidoglycan/LPS O-acetylase OafA/YrhL